MYESEQLWQFYAALQGAAVYHMPSHQSLKH